MEDENPAGFSAIFIRLIPKSCSLTHSPPASQTFAHPTIHFKRDLVASKTSFGGKNKVDQSLFHYSGPLARGRG